MNEKPQTDSGKDLESKPGDVPAAAEVDDRSDEGSGLWIDLDIQAKADEVERRIDAHAENYAARANIPGFRKGKVPAEVVKKRYRKLIVDEALTEVIESFVQDRIRKDNLQVVSRPELRDVKYEEGGDLKASVRVEVLPEVKLPDLEQFTVEIPADQLKVKDFDESEQIDHFLEHNQRREPVTDRPVGSGDVVAVKHQAMNLENKRMTPRKPMQVLIDADAQNEITEIEKELTGRSIGAEVVFRRKYPKDHARKAWAGKEMEHHVTIESVNTLVKPDLNEEFLKSLGFDSRKAFLDRLRQEYESQSSKAREERVMGAIAEKLVESAPFAVPETLLRQEMMQAIRQNPGLMHVKNEEEKGRRIAELEALAARNIRFSLLVEAVKTEFGVKVDAEELEKRLREMAESSGVPLKEVRKYYAPAERRNQLMDSLERDKALEILREKVTIKEV